MENGHILDTGLASPEKNMQIDSDLLEKLTPDGQPILHLYDWADKSATYGYFTNPFQHLTEEGVKMHGIKLAKRPTGGGIIFHTTDYAFSILIPSRHKHFSLNTLENYAFVNSLVIKAISHFLGTIPELLPNEPNPLDNHCKHFCMAKPTKYDVILQGKKVGGGAQRRTKNGFLHQGSIALTSPDFLSDILQPGTAVKEAMESNSFFLLGPNASQFEIEKARLNLKKLLSELLISHIN